MLSKAYESLYLKYIKSIKSRSIYIIEVEIPRYLYTAHKDYDYYVNILTLNFLIERVY